jgi:hypothetical protein
MHEPSGRQDVQHVHSLSFLPYPVRLQTRRNELRLVPSRIYPAIRAEERAMNYRLSTLRFKISVWFALLRAKWLILRLRLGEKIED